MSERSDAVTAGGGAAPAHVAIIMDGNGRWAQHRGLPRIAGHRRGVEAVREAIAGAHETGVRYLTLFGFSSENWKRPLGEITDLMQLLRHYLRGEIAELHKHAIRLRVIGDRSKLQSDIVTMIDSAEETTRNNDALHLTVALSYGGRSEIVAAARRIAEAVAKGEMTSDQVDEECFGRFLSTSGIPDPDLVIRTSGEQRLSNFLLWQSAYAELIFVETLWPEFTRNDFREAVREYQRRERRYGAATA
jgi:undecaprenyl diphosphate synthase